MKTILIAATVLAWLCLARATDITQAEYFFDSDPGYGNGVALAVAASDTPWVCASVDISTLSTGLHRCYLRYRDERGLWSIADVRLFYLFTAATPDTSDTITAAEYFLNSDPGQGNGTPVTVTSGPAPTVSFPVDITAFSFGMHLFGLRYKDERNNWSIADTRLFYITQITTPDTSDTITAAEYFINGDPGQGNGTAITVASGSAPIVSFPVDITALAPGMHRFYLRYKDEHNNWSIADARPFYLTQIVTPQPCSITAAEYFFTADPGFGHGTALTVVPSDTPSVVGEISTAGLPDGLNRCYLRYRDDRDRWSIADTRLFYIVRQSGNSEFQTLAGAEFFINVDPGLGLGAAMMPIDGVWDDTLETVIDSVTGVPVGLHLLGLRYLDNRGTWSATAVDTFVVGPLLTVHLDSSLTSIILVWRTGPETASFDVQRSTTTGGSYSTIATVSDSVYTDIGILAQPGTQRFYQIVQNSASRSSFRYPSAEDVERRRASKHVSKR